MFVVDLMTMPVGNFTLRLVAAAVAIVVVIAFGRPMASPQLSSLDAPFSRPKMHSQSGSWSQKFISFCPKHVTAEFLFLQPTPLLVGASFFALQSNKQTIFELSLQALTWVLQVILSPGLIHLSISLTGFVLLSTPLVHLHASEESLC